MKETPMTQAFKEYILFLRPFVDLAINGKYNGHNMNRGFYETVDYKQIPIVFNDSVYSILKIIANSTSAYRKSDKFKTALNFIYDDQKVFKAGWLWADEIGLGSSLFWCLKTLEAYLLKNA